MPAQRVPCRAASWSLRRAARPWAFLSPSGFHKCRWVLPPRILSMAATPVLPSRAEEAGGTEPNPWCWLGHVSQEDGGPAGVLPGELQQGWQRLCVDTARTLRICQRRVSWPPLQGWSGQRRPATSSCLLQAAVGSQLPWPETLVESVQLQVPKAPVSAQDAQVRAGTPRCEAVGCGRCERPHRSILV